MKSKKYEFIIIAIFGLLILGASFFYSDDAITGYAVSEDKKYENLIGPPANCGGKGLPPESHIKAFESKAWGSDKTIRELVIQYSLANGVHPALVAAYASKESSMGENACHKYGRSSLTGCSWPGSSCQTGCSETSNCMNDETQISCTARTIKTAYNDAIMGYATSGLPYYNCAKYKNSQQSLWNCIFCTYVHGFLDEQSCVYNMDIKNFFCQWANYLGENYEVEIPEEGPAEISEDSSGAYEFTPVFEAESNFDLYYYETIIAQAKKLIQDIELCKISKDTGDKYTEQKTKYNSETGLFEEVTITYKKQETDLDKCLEAYMPENWELDCEAKDKNRNDTTFMFCVPLPYRIKLFNEETGKMEEKIPTVKFAMQFKRNTLDDISTECTGIKGRYSYDCVPLKLCDGAIDNSMETCEDNMVCCKTSAQIEVEKLSCDDLEGYKCMPSCSSGRTYPGASCASSPMYPLVCCLSPEEESP